MASPDRLARTVTRRPAHSGTGATDQSDRPRVTTAPSCGTPSENSTPALSQVSSSPQHESGLVELPLEGDVDGHLDGTGVGQRGEQGVRVVVDEPVGGVPPRVAALG